MWNVWIFNDVNIEMFAAVLEILMLVQHYVLVRVRNDTWPKGRLQLDKLKSLKVLTRLKNLRG